MVSHKVHGVQDAYRKVRVHAATAACLRDRTCDCASPSLSLCLTHTHTVTLLLLSLSRITPNARGYEVPDTDRFMWEPEFVKSVRDWIVASVASAPTGSQSSSPPPAAVPTHFAQFGEAPNRQLLNFTATKATDESYTCVVLFPEDHLTAGTIRKYGEYMREHKFRWALVVLFNERPTRLAVQAVAALLPKAYIEYVE